MTAHPEIAGDDSNDADSDFTEDGSTPMVEEKLELAKRENKAVWMLRLFTTVILVVVAIAVCLLVYFQGRQSEQENFEVGFTELGRKVVSSFELDVRQRLGIMESFSMDLTSFVNQNANISWPFYTPADYERRAGLTAKLARIPYLYLLPRVEHWQKTEWENYAMANQGWIAEGLAIQQGVEPEDINARPIIPIMMRLKDGNLMVEDRPGPYFPFWMSYPASNFSFVNWNTYGEGENGKIFLDAALKKKKPTFPESLDFWNDEEKEKDFIFTGIKHVFPSYEGSPYHASYYPVFDHLGEDRQIVAFILAASIWREYFGFILPEGAVGVYVVVDNACGQVFTFRLDGSSASFVDFGDLHDPKYDHLGETANMNSIVDPEGDDSEATRGDCYYRIRVYPSEDFEDRYYTKSPMLFSVALAAVFLFTCSVFLFYDYMVERRQKVVMKSATRSGKLVSSLFPEAVRNRLYEEEEAMNNRESNGKTWRTSRTEDDTQSDKAAIATLYPETTIFFADLAGFTKWSSTRTPVEVFELLEQLYGAFDAIASRYKVFKVETIGDCYVAVTGLPDPQPNHAVLMVKFARSCMSKMHTVTASLADKLGEDTTTLEMRVGLHSGPVTAGVLRGKKSRFQLFGDSVNTASRMESNGIKGRIQCSQTTADALIADGKSHWLTPRAEKVLAKGKGEMQTYWVNVAHSGPGTASSGGETTSLTASIANALGSDEKEENDQDFIEKAEQTITQIQNLVLDPGQATTGGQEGMAQGNGWMLQTSRL